MHLQAEQSIMIYTHLLRLVKGFRGIIHILAQGL